MAARSVFKLFSKTYTYSFSPTCPSSTYSPLPANRNKKVERQHRSYSQPNNSPGRINKDKESFISIRQISRSLENFRDNHPKGENVYIIQEDRSDYNNFPVADLTVRETAKEFKEKYVQLEEQTEEGNPIYEIAEGSKTRDNYFNVIDFMANMEKEKSLRIFPHLQPSNIKPYGSNENIYIQDMYRKKIQIVYPVVNTTSQEQTNRKKRIDDIPHKEYSSYRKQPAVASGNVRKKVANTEKTSSKMNYSTTSLTTRKADSKLKTDSKPPKMCKNSNFYRNSSTSHLMKHKNKFPLEDSLELNRIGIMDQFYQRTNAFQEVKETIKSRENVVKSASRSNSSRGLLNKSKTNIDDSGRKFNTYSKTTDKKDNFSKNNRTGNHSKASIQEVINENNRRYTTSSKPTKPTKSSEPICEEYVTVKLGDLKEECRREKRCKPKKICFGKLPKLAPPDCPCYEDLPLKEGKPLVRLQKRFDVKPKPKICEVVVCDTPRADANYKIKRKPLPQIIPAECPCTEREFIDFNIKRLPRVKIPEPPRVCPPCDDPICCPPPERADAKFKIEKKVLPKLEANDCPCIEDKPMKDVPLFRLKPNPVKEPVRKCPPPADCSIAQRADDNLKVKQKTLPILQPGCICVEPPPMDDVPPLPRLKKVKIEEKPRPSCDVVPCADTVRADRCLKVEPKRLPVFVPQNCPCIEERIPNEDVKLKRLIKRPITVERKEICVVEECPARADDGMVIKPKKLPVITPGECPCVEPFIEDVPPLKKLIPKPIEPPPKVCLVEEPCPVRADEGLRVEKKSLPVLPPGSCPCVEPEPMLDVPPLVKLKKRPVFFKRVCIQEEECPSRADENLKIEIKRLPPLKAADCPCIEPPPPEDVRPLKRLKKVRIAEPLRICPPEDTCVDVPRADETDWLYWKRVEVKSAECEELKTSKKPVTNTKRSFSTCIQQHSNIFQTKRFYSTKTKNEDFHLKYDVSNLCCDQFLGNSYNIIIDIKPSAPLILTQTSIGYNSSDQNKFDMDVMALKHVKHKPVDCVTFIVYKANTLVPSKSKGGIMKDSNDGMNVLCSTFNRFISTSTTFYDYSERSKEKIIDHQPPQCECPPNDGHLQPKNPILPDKECFIEPPYPSDDVIDNSARKSRMYYRTRKDSEGKEVEEDDCEDEEEKALCECEEENTQTAAAKVKTLTLWEKIVNYFKARPDCPSPEEFRRMRLKEDAEKAAAKAGLCLYDPKEMLRKNEKDLPKVITAGKSDHTSK